MTDNWIWWKMFWLDLKKKSLHNGCLILKPDTFLPHLDPSLISSQAEDLTTFSVQDGATTRPYFQQLNIKQPTQPPAAYLFFQKERASQT